MSSAPSDTTVVAEAGALSTNTSYSID